MTLPSTVASRWLATDDVRTHLATATGVRYYGPPVEGRRPAGPGRAHPVHFVDAADGVPIGIGDAVWSWWSDDSAPLTVQDVTCKIPSDEGPSHELLVAPSLQWLEVEIVASARVLPLALDHRFLLARLVSEGGAGAWSDLVIGGSLDGCLALLFAAAVAAGEQGPQLLPLGDSHEGPWVALSWWFRTGLAARLVEPPHSLLGAPMETALTAFGSPNVDGLGATFLLSRPAHTRMIGCEADIEGRYRARAGGDHFALPSDDGGGSTRSLARPFPWVIAPPLRPRTPGAAAERQSPFGHHDALHWWAPRAAEAPRVGCDGERVTLATRLRSSELRPDGTVTLGSGTALFGMDVDRTGA